MFGIGGPELFFIALLALMLFGPEKLPEFARTIGRFMRDFKRYQDIMQSTIRAEMLFSEPPTEAKGSDKRYRERIEEEQARARGASTEAEPVGDEAETATPGEPDPDEAAPSDEAEVASTDQMPGEVEEEA